jgi:hypothetical protein
MRVLKYSFLILLISIELAQAGLGIGMFGNRNTIHTLDGSERGKIFIKSARKDLQNTLEFRHYSGIVSEFLLQNGFKRTKNEGEAKYIAILNYGLSTENMYTETYQFDVANDIGHSISAEIIEYALLPKKTYVRNNKFTRVFEMDIYDLKLGQKTSHIYKGRIVSKGKCGEMQQVAPHLIKMLFKKWPGKNGNKKILSMKSGVC